MGRTLTASDGIEGSSLGGSSGWPIQRILLVGFMGSGKTTVGRLLAAEMGWRFVDLDEAIELADGRAIPQIFSEDGEEAFREVEHALADEILAEDGVVLASGGGWPCRESRLEGVTFGTLSIWLKVSSEEALDRVSESTTPRPLLDVPDPLARIRELIAVRELYYRKAGWWVDTDLHLPRDVVQRVIDRLRTDPERPLQA